MWGGRNKQINYTYVLEWKIVERVNREDNAEQIQPKRFLVDIVKIQT